MYYKGTTMDEIQKYLTEELQSAKEEKENVLMLLLYIILYFVEYLKYFSTRLF